MKNLIFSVKNIKCQTCYKELKIMDKNEIWLYTDISTFWEKMHW